MALSNRPITSTITLKKSFQDNNNKIDSSSQMPYIPNQT